MRLVTFIHQKQEYAGVKHKDGYYALRSLIGDLAGENLLASMLDFIRWCEGRGLPDFGALIAESGARMFSTEEIKLLAPIPRPFRHVICLGKNYEDHAKEIKETIQTNQNENLIPAAPIYFTKTACPAMSDGDVLPLHEKITQKVDYEAELAVIIGKTARDIAQEKAEDVIFGYTVLNDLTARDLQVKHAQWFFAKSLDGLSYGAGNSYL